MDEFDRLIHWKLYLGLPAWLWLRNTFTTLRYSPGEGDLEGFEAGDEGGEFGKGLFAGAADADEQGVPARRPDDPGDLHQVDHGVGEEDEVHAGAPDTLVVLTHEHLQALLQLVKRLNLQ